MLHFKDTEKLFAEFPKVSKKEWLDKIKLDLKDENLIGKLYWNTKEGFTVDPFYTREDQHQWDYLRHFNPKNQREIQPSSHPAWIYFEKIRIGQIQKAIKKMNRAVSMGADGLHFTIENEELDFLDIVVKMPEQVKGVMISCEAGPDTIIKALNGKFSGDQGPNFLIDHDPIQKFIRTGKIDLNEIDHLSALINEAKNIENLKAWSIRGDHFVNAGANMAMEVGLTLSLMVEYFDQLTDRGLNPDEIIGSAFIYLGVGTNYFMEIAKIRAIRVLIHHLLDLYGFKNFDSSTIHIHAETSQWTKTYYDPYVNMLRSTTEAMSGILGGCDSLSIRPFDEAISTPNKFSNRIARNISNILKEESYFDRVVDPAAGSYYVDALTDKIIEASLDIFRYIETEGGYLASFRKGILKEMIKASRENKYQALRMRKDVLVGTSYFPNLTEERDEGRPKNMDHEGMNDDILQPYRASEDFELLRLKTDRYSRESGRRPKVFLALMGKNAAIRNARASFSSAFFGCAGFDIQEGIPSHDTFKAVEKAISSKADIIVLCGANEDYQASGVDFVNALKSNIKAWLVIAGNPKNKEQLELAGIDEFITIQSDVIDILSQFQEKLNIR